MQAKEFYFLDDAAKFITEKTNQVFSANDLISKAIEGKTFLFISASNWEVKVYNTATIINFDDYVPIDTPKLKLATKGFRKGVTETSFPDFFVTSQFLHRFGIVNDDENTLLQPVKSSSCLFSKADLVIKHDDLLDFIEKYCPVINIKSNTNTSQPAAIKNQNIFRRTKTGTWDIKFEESEQVNMPSCIGFHYVRQLLMHQNKKISSVELQAMFAPLKKSKKQPDIDELANENLIVRDSLEISEKIIDDKAINQYKQRILELKEKIQEEIEFDNIQTAEKLEHELDLLSAEIKKNTDQSGNIKVINKTKRNINDAVYQNIKISYGNLNKIYPALVDHLKKSIKTGIDCTYTPKTKIKIKIKWTLD